ncbi:hypothetical protein L207DRAFT_575784 [Hyaloscypha variabilis F]|uniref:PH domain-containing protein n=1 Tax=Hyaloscypha variabilis (strain UAMH 11265 / GT02V1 / F) TaxID=1149755 RepID=A0A2J6S892_HYAVF|nr:hypothetical protein L207DRAFT_575784 [Hyaloscypha variabilis F]
MSLATPGSYTCQVFWKGDPGIESFTLKLPTERRMKIWVQELEMMRKEYSIPTKLGKDPEVTPDFSWMRDQLNPIANLYARSDNKDDGNEELVTASGSTRSGDSTSPRPTPPPASPRPPPRLDLMKGLSYLRDRVGQ